MISLVILTSSNNRHKFFANTLARSFSVVGVVSEDKRPVSTFATVEENQLVIDHFKERNNAESRYFGSDSDFNLPPSQVKEVSNGGVNSLEVFEWIKDRGPDYVILFGTSIIKPPLLSYYYDRMINIHLGLSPYYRGSGTNFWPLVNNEPEYVGATIHLAVKKVDAGAILSQVRPEIVNSDGPHDIGCKTIIAGVQAMIKSIKAYKANKIKPQEQILEGGRVYKKSDFNPTAVVKMRQNFQVGMIDDYLKEKDQRDSHCPLINL